MRFLSLFFLLSFASLQATVQTSFGAGYRCDHQRLDFSIPGCDPISDLDWKELESVEFLFRARRDCNHLHYFVDLGIGLIDSGDFIDRDWCSIEGMHTLFSNTISDVTGCNYDIDLGLSRDLSRGCGYRFRLGGGLAYHQQYYRLWGLRQRLNIPDFPFFGTNLKVASFRSQWFSGWLGLAVDLCLQGGWEVALDGRFHFGGHESSGDWRCRSDLQPGKGWSNSAEAYGAEISGRLSRMISPGWSVDLLVYYRYFWTDGGDHHTYTSNGFRIETDLGEVEWSSVAIISGFTFRF